MMITVKDVLSYIETLAPSSMKMEWDNIGLLCGKADQQVHKILVALDPFESVCREAFAIGADLIVTHHPLIFGGLQSVTDETGAGRAVLFLASHDISAVNAHTNLDCAPGGVNDILAQILGLTDVQVLDPVGIDPQGQPWGLLRQGVAEAQPLETFLSHVKTALGCPGLRYADADRLVHRVAVGGGSCAGELAQVIRAGCDTFVTADVKYNQFWEAQEAGINLIDAGHFYTENPVCPVLAAALQTNFPDIQVVLSQKHTDCAKFFV